MAGYEDLYWWSTDGIRLHARDWAGDPARPPLICLPGLTRNARDYDALAARLAPAWRVIAVDFRGRGESGYAKDPLSYVPLSYVQDLEALLAAQGIERFVAVGTSLGGIVATLVAGLTPGRIVGALLNDVGPEIEAAGLARIRGYVGRGSTEPTWLHAARALREAHGEAHPHWAIEDWLAMAKRVYRLNSAGRIVLDYDLKIAEPFRVPAAAEPAPDLWPAYRALDAAPVLVVRGARSDVLSAEVAARMARELPRVELVTVAGMGHAPTLDEPEVVAALDRMLGKVAEPAAG